MYHLSILEGTEATQALGAVVTQFAVVWGMIYLIFKASKKKTAGWIVTEVICIFLLIVLGFGLIGEEINGRTGGAAAAYILAIIAFLPFSIARAFTHRTWPWIVCGSLSGAVVLVIIGFLAMTLVSQKSTLGQASVPASVVSTQTPASHKFATIEQEEDALRRVNETVYAILIKHGVPNTKADANILQYQVGMAQTPVAIESMRELGGIHHTSRKWWDNNILNDDRYSLEERIRVRDGVDLCFGLAKEITARKSQESNLVQATP